MKILDLGCGSGYLTFPIAQNNEKAYVVGLDIVTDTLERNAVKAQEMDIHPHCRYIHIRKMHMLRYLL